MNLLDVDEITNRINGKYEISRNEILREMRSICDSIEGTEKVRTIFDKFCILKYAHLFP